MIPSQSYHLTIDIKWGTSLLHKDKLNRRALFFLFFVFFAFVAVPRPLFVAIGFCASMFFTIF